MSYHHGNLREALLQRAADVIAERGVEAVSLRALARDLGVSHSAPRRHFADRGALLAEIARVGFLMAREAMDVGAERAGPDPVARYRALGRSYVAFARENRPYFLAANHPTVLAEGGQALRDEQRAWLATLRDGAKSAREAGWQPDVDIDTLVAFSVASTMGAAMLLGDDKWCQLLDCDNVDALADRVLDLVVNRGGNGEHSGGESPLQRDTKEKNWKAYSKAK